MAATMDLSFDPELQAEQQSLLQREKMAEILMQRGMPQGSVTGRMSPFQAIAQGLAPALSMHLQNKNMEAERALGTKANERLAAGVQDYMQQRNGSPEIPQPAEELGGGPGRPAMPGNPRDAMVNAMVSRNPLVRSLGTMDYTHQLKKDDPFTLPEGALRVPGGGLPSVANPKVPEHTVPDGWEAHVPAGATAVGRGTVKMPGADGLPDLYTMEYERGQFKGLKKLDSSPKPPTINNNNPAPVTVTTVANPDKPGETLQVDARVYKGGGPGSPGVIGAGAKLTQTGSAGLKLEVGKPEAQSRISSLNQNLDRLDAAVEGLHNHKGLEGITGTLYGRTPALTNSATGALGQLNSIKSQIFQSSLQAMRETSKTGGAVGNVSDKEGDKFERTLAALDRSMGTKEFKQELRKVQEQLRLSKARINQAFQEQYGQTENFVPPKAGGGGAVPPPPDGFKPL